MHWMRPTLLFLSILSIYACSSDGDDSTDGSDGSGGSTQGTGGAGSGDGGTGADGSGGAGTGGASPTGGSGGQPNGGLGGGGLGGMGPGGATATGGSGSDLTLDDCFVGLPEPVGTFQDATKESADGEYRMRLALETGDRFGTSGTSPWGPMRLAIETPAGVVCLDDAEVLAQGHTVTHHNCDDTLIVTVGTTRYEIANPDTASDTVDPEAWRRPSTLTIYESDLAVGDPIRLDTVSCNATTFDDGICRSGGPC